MFQKILVFAIAKRADGVGFGVIFGRAMRKRHPARRKEGRHPVIARLAVDIASVVNINVKGNEWFARLCRPLLEKPVEQPFPGLGMDAGGFRQDSVEVEQNRVVVPWGESNDGA